MLKDEIYRLFTRYPFWISSVKTKLYYSLFFGHIGHHVLIIKPELISNPSRIFIGNNVIIHSNARILCVCKFNNQCFNPSIRIGNDVKIQQGLHMSCADKIIIEDGVTIAQYVGIFDIDHNYNDIHLPVHKQPITTKKIIIGKNSFIGKGAVIMKGTVIGKNCIIGANAVVKGVFPDYSVIAGIPAKLLKRIKLLT